MTLVEQQQAIESREDFVAFVQALTRNLQTNREEWENDTLENFLDALGVWVESMDNYYINTGQPVPKQLDWKVLGDILMAAKVYE